MASNFKRGVLNQKYRRQLRHDCCKEVKGMLSGETGKTIFKCWRFNVFLSNITSIIFAWNRFAFFLRKVWGPEGSCMNRSDTAFANKIASFSIAAKNKIQETTLHNSCYYNNYKTRLSMTKHWALWNEYQENKSVWRHLRLNEGVAIPPSPVATPLTMSHFGCLKC